MRQMLAMLVLGFCLVGSGCGAHVKTGVSPVADIANAGGKIEDTGQAIFQAVVKAHDATPTVVSQDVEDKVAIAVNRLGHAGLTLNGALTAYNTAKAAGTDLMAQRATVQRSLDVVNQFLTEVGKALPPGTLQTVDALVNTIISVILQVKTGVGL